jgi:hypothetical protein
MPQPPIVTRPSRARTIIGSVRHRELSRERRDDGLLARLRSWWFRDELDEAIARGERLEGDLAVRARQLTRHCSTAALAAQLDAVLSVTRYEDSSEPCDVDLSREAIAAGERDLRRLIQRLRADDPPDPRGVALATRLVRDVDSPLYEPARPDDLRHDVLAALDRMDGAAEERYASPLARLRGDLVNTAEHSSTAQWPQIQNG